MLQIEHREHILVGLRDTGYFTDGIFEPLVLELARMYAIIHEPSFLDRVLLAYLIHDVYLSKTFASRIRSEK